SAAGTKRQTRARGSGITHLYDATNRGSRSHEDRNRRRRADRRQPSLAVGEAAPRGQALLLARPGEPRAGGVGDRSARVGRERAGGGGVRRRDPLLGPLV